ncbi:hypothetical protein GCM10010232_55710 [Streptomyces amakusaensis]|uniref:TetR family transcriptional regulator n=1 Tax=Streptomyces amakusaensis TaxID=67271 RepID=A0ABW0AP11_9ACTN
MRALAAELGVTVRALYNYVEDRQDVVDLALGLMPGSWTVPPLDPAAREESVTGYARSLRALYRRRPRALPISLDEDAPPISVHPNRLLNLDRFLRLLHGIGIGIGTGLGPAPDAVLTRSARPRALRPPRALAPVRRKGRAARRRARRGG